METDLWTFRARWFELKVMGAQKTTVSLRAAFPREFFCRILKKSSVVKEVRELCTVFKVNKVK